jgi:DNA-binding NarL/FixJ family response regulator
MLSATQLLPKLALLPAPISPEAAWRGVFAGHYRIAAWYDRAGRRYVVARQQAPGDDAPLTTRQRRVLAMRARGTALKVIGFELGLSIGTVSRELTLAMDRLGLVSFSDLAAVSVASADAGEGALEPLPCPRGLVVSPLEADADGAEAPGMLLSFPLDSAPSLPAVLTHAEREVVEGILAGLLNREIAARRGVSPRTVANQVSRIFEKLRVGSRLTLALSVRGVCASAAAGA